MKSSIEYLFNNQLKINKKIGYENNTEIYEGTYYINSSLENVIVKIIPIKDHKKLEQMIIEMGFLQYLSKFKTSKKYINLCHNIKLTSSDLIVILEKPKGVTLKQFIQNIHNLPWDKYYRIITVIMYRLLLAINYIHSKGVAHRGLNEDSIYIDYRDDLIEDLKISNFAVSCGKYVTIPQSQINLNVNINENNVYNKVCNTIHLEITPPENFNLDSLINKIKKLAKDQTRESIYLYLAKKTDIWTLGILFWKLLNRNNLQENPLNRKFPTNYKTSTNWKTYNGNHTDSVLIEKLYEIVINLMLNEIPFRGKSEEILENFITISKYFDENNDNN
jgi:serine/threonine protein kinase